MVLGARGRKTCLDKSSILNFLFKICGNYHLVLFWLHVKASWSSLCIFKQVFAEEGPDVWKEEAKDKKLERAVQMVRDAA